MVTARQVLLAPVKLGPFESPWHSAPCRELTARTERRGGPLTMRRLVRSIRTRNHGGYLSSSTNKARHAHRRFLHNLLFLTHPQVAIDPAIPVPDWTLSQLGASRMERFAASPVLAGVTAIYSSGERKAVDTARILSERTGCPLVWWRRCTRTTARRPATCRPSSSRRWPTASSPSPKPVCSAGSGQSTRRLGSSRCIHGILERDTTPGDIVIAAHGGVGALLLAHLLGKPISRRFDQPGSGGGNFFTWRRAALELLREWQSIDVAS